MKRPIPATTEEALGRQYSQDSWSLGGMLANLERMQDLWGVDVSEAQEAIRRVKLGITQVWKEVK